MEAVLAKLAELLPKDQKVVILADRAYGNAAFIDRVQGYRWDWLVRLQRQTCFEQSDGWKGQLCHYLVEIDPMGDNCPLQATLWH